MGKKIRTIGKKIRSIHCSMFSIILRLFYKTFRKETIPRKHSCFRKQHLINKIGKKPAPQDAESAGDVIPGWKNIGGKF